MKSLFFLGLLLDQLFGVHDTGPQSVFVVAARRALDASAAAASEPALGAVAQVEGVASAVGVLLEVSKRPRHLQLRQLLSLEILVSFLPEVL